MVGNKQFLRLFAFVFLDPNLLRPSFLIQYSLNFEKNPMNYWLILTVTKFDLL